MSDRLTLKESVGIIGTAFKTVRKRVIVWSCVGGVLLGGIMGVGLLTGEATQADLSGEKVAHIGCTVANKVSSPLFNGRQIMGYKYALDTTCGTFSATGDIYKLAEVGQSYDLTTSNGNWANQPTVTSLAAVSVK